ncbi:hypothetical protein V6N11_081244 [Hibiscus sabdariffa]|uniref:Reverse transcriptase zinc-binding domain-containing protein n=1 Tax=Hibiscus sabdariffa TaxID=183260 RepID=A0ABR2QJS1_9ROSI
MPGDLSGFLRWWNSQPTFPSLKAVWKMIFYETIWTIWRCRNEALFNAKYCNEFRSIFGVAVSGIFKSCKGCVQASFRMPLSSEMWKLYCQNGSYWEWQWIPAIFQDCHPQSNHSMHFIKMLMFKKWNLNEVEVAFLVQHIV